MPQQPDLNDMICEHVQPGRLEVDVEENAIVNLQVGRSRMLENLCMDAAILSPVCSWFAHELTPIILHIAQSSEQAATLRAPVMSSAYG